MNNTISRLKNTQIFTALLAIIITFPFVASGNTVYKTRIDWSRGIIMTTTEAGFSTDGEGNPVAENQDQKISITKGRLNSYREAREKAVIRIAGRLRTLRLDPENILIDIINKNIRTKKLISRCIDSKIRTEIFPVNYSTSGCHAELSFGDIIETLPFSYPEDEFPKPMGIPVTTDYTSLIIDARHLNLQEMVFPVIYNEDGLQVFSRYHIDIRYAAKYSMVSYVTNEKEALSHKKAGEHPYYTAALKNLNGCPVISNRDCGKILTSRKSRESLRKCKVIFVVKKRNKE